MSGKTAYIWILRVYKLKEPYWAEHTPGVIRYANLKEEVSLERMEPVLSDSEVEQVIENVKINWGVNFWYLLLLKVGI